MRWILAATTKEQMLAGEKLSFSPRRGCCSVSSRISPTRVTARRTLSGWPQDFTTSMRVNARVSGKTRAFRLTSSHRYNTSPNRTESLLMKGDTSRAAHEALGSVPPCAYLSRWQKISRGSNLTSQFQSFFFFLARPPEHFDETELAWTLQGAWRKVLGSSSARVPGEKHHQQQQSLAKLGSGAVPQEVPDVALSCKLLGLAEKDYGTRFLWRAKLLRAESLAELCARC